MIHQPVQCRNSAGRSHKARKPRKLDLLCKLKENQRRYRLFPGSVLVSLQLGQQIEFSSMNQLVCKEVLLWESLLNNTEIDIRTWHPLSPSPISYYASNSTWHELLLRDVKKWGREHQPIKCQESQGCLLSGLKWVKLNACPIIWAVQRGILFVSPYFTILRWSTFTTKYSETSLERN